MPKGSAKSKEIKVVTEVLPRAGSTGGLFLCGTGPPSHGGRARARLAPDLAQHLRRTYANRAPFPPELARTV